MSLYLNNKRPFHYEVMDISKKWKTKADMCNRKLLLKVELYFGRANNASSNEDVLGGNALKDTVKKKRLQITR